MHTQKIIYLSKNNLLIAAFILEDTPRLHAKEFILSLKKREVGKIALINLKNKGRLQK